MLRGTRTSLPADLHREYTGPALQRIGMPVGGGCSGQVYLAGDGKLWAWDILNPSVTP